MTVHTFEQIIDGVVIFCIACEKQIEREELLAGRGVTPSSAPAPAIIADAAPSELRPPLQANEEDQPRSPGRPPFDDDIAAAIAALGDEIEGIPRIAAQARRVRQYLREGAHKSGDMGSIPHKRTIERYLTELRQKSRQKSRQK